LSQNGFDAGAMETHCAGMSLSKRNWLNFAGVLLLAAGCSMMSSKLNYPMTVKTNVVDNYHGINVTDPYRWLEDDNSPATKAWVEEQNKVTFSYLNAIPGRATVHARLTKLWNYERYGVPFKEGKRYFYQRNNGLQNQSVLYTVDSWTRNRAYCWIRTRWPRMAPWRSRACR
jgi:Prolyl oligopeptidase, N-terminal beta-propeller domain